MQRTGEDPLEVGRTMVYVGTFLGRRYESPVACTTLIENKQLTTTTTGGPFFLEVDQRLEPDGAGTRLTVHCKGESRGFFKLAEPLVIRLTPPAVSSASHPNPFPGTLAHSRRLGDNDGMARDRRGDRLLRRLTLMSVLDGIRPSKTLEWVSPLAPVVTQVAVGAGHWAAGRRQRALAAWASAAGFGLMAWGLGTEAPTRAETHKNIEQQKDLWRERGIEVPATARPHPPTARQRSRLVTLIGPALQVVGMVNSVRSGLRHPRRLTVLAIASEAWAAVFWVLRLARAVHMRRPRIAAGSALGLAGAVARLRATSAEPLP